MEISVTNDSASAYGLFPDSSYGDYILNFIYPQTPPHVFLYVYIWAQTLKMASGYGYNPQSSKTQTLGLIMLQKPSKNHKCEESFPRLAYLTTVNKFILGSYSIPIFCCKGNAIWYIIAVFSLDFIYYLAICKAYFNAYIFSISIFYWGKFYVT